MTYDGKKPDETDDEYFSRVTESMVEAIQAETSTKGAYKFLVNMVNNMQNTGLTRLEAIQFVASFYATYYVITDPKDYRASSE